MLDSPIPGIGPRLLEAVAAFHVAADRVPGALAMDAVLLGGSAAVERALREPARVRLRCGRRRHVVTIDRDTCRLDSHGGGDLDAESIAAVLQGGEVPACVALARAWRRGDAWNWRSARYVLQLRTALAWQEAGADLAEVDDFVAWGVTPADVDAGARHGLDPATVLAWGPVVGDIGAAAGWIATGWTLAEARQLHRVVSPEESRRWRAEGFDVPRILEARAWAGGAPLPLEIATTAYDAKLPLADVREFVGRGVPLDELLRIAVDVRRENVGEPGHLRHDLWRRSAEAWIRNVRRPAGVSA